MKAIKYLTFLIFILVSFTVFPGESSAARVTNSDASFVNTFGPRHRHGWVKGHHKSKRHVWVKGHYKVNRHGILIWVPGQWRKIRC